MKKTAQNVFWSSIIFYYIIHTISQDLDGTYCYTDNDEDNTTFLEFMNSLDTFTFNTNYTIKIRNCTNGQESPSQYDYILDNSVIWVKRFEIYDEFHDDLVLCKNCSTTNFQECMKAVRSEMTIRIGNKTDEIQDFLLQTKEELESNCL
ncbi:uncharacterized protein LOC108735895 [Agrilus planipennis]|uniref:Uncharacterized protein LOC108735895 n=1 Tax=Agrilus planipennis TaxID=224129 RepID=A0A1W4WI38_AGRPL|nr:uncharacterized protein LOC108735895 [Agrilus planipennis]